MTIDELRFALDVLVPPFDDREADWNDAVRRGGTRRRPRVVLAVALAVAVLAGLAASPLGHALVGGAFDRLSAWVGGSPGGPAPSAEQHAVREANARSAAPIPSDSELGLLTRGTIDGDSFDLLGFRDHDSLCLRLRSSAGNGEPIYKAPANCVAQQLLIDLGKPLAVFEAANPFPRRAKPGLQALYGLAADGVAAVELQSQGGVQRVPVTNNAFLYLYRGEGPRSENNRLVYASDVPSRATALDANGHALDSVEITSLKRGFAAPPRASELPGPSVVERELASARIGWLDRHEERGDAYDWRGPDGKSPPGVVDPRIFQPNSGTSMRVIVMRSTSSAIVDPKYASDPVYCVTNLWPLEQRPAGFRCGPVHRLVGFPLAAETVFDDQFPVFYGLVADGVSFLELILANGVKERVPIVDNVFAFQAASASPAKLVGYDADGRVISIHVVAL
jgi:hypothetical protein